MERGSRCTMTQAGASSSSTHSEATRDMRGSFVTHGRWALSFATTPFASAVECTLVAGLSASKPYATQSGRV